jgi:amino acid transporter
MNTQEEYNDDLMKEYLNSSMVEKAPEGFTANMMSRISLEAGPVQIRQSLFRRYSVPLISVTVTLILVLSVLFLPASGHELTGSPFINLIRNISVPAFKLNLEHLVSIRVPGYLPYLFISILLLAFFDKGLNMMFHKEK